MSNRGRGTLRGTGRGQTGRASQHPSSGPRTGQQSTPSPRGSHHSSPSARLSPPLKAPTSPFSSQNFANRLPEPAYSEKISLPLRGPCDKSSQPIFESIDKLVENPEPSPSDPSDDENSLTKTFTDGNSLILVPEPVHVVVAGPDAHIPKRPDYRAKGMNAQVLTNNLVLRLFLGHQCNCYELHLTSIDGKRLSAKEFQSPELLRKPFEKFEADIGRRLEKGGPLRHQDVLEYEHGKVQQRHGLERTIVATDYCSVAMSFEALPTGEIFKVKFRQSPMSPETTYNYSLTEWKRTDISELIGKLLSKSNTTRMSAQGLGTTLSAILTSQLRKEITLEAIIRATSTRNPLFQHNDAAYNFGQGPRIAVTMPRGRSILLKDSGRMLANVEATPYFYQPQPLHQFIRSLAGQLGWGPALKTFLQGVRVREIFGNGRTRVLRGLVGSDDVPGMKGYHTITTWKFRTKEGNETTVKAHFDKVHNKKDLAQHELALDVGFTTRGTNHVIMVPASCLEVVPYNLFMSKLSRLWQRKDAGVDERDAQYTVTKMFEAMQLVLKNSPYVKMHDTGSEKSTSHLSIIGDSTVVPGNICAKGKHLDTQIVGFSDDKTFKTANARWNIMEKKFVQGAQLDRLLVLEIMLRDADTEPVVNDEYIRKLAESLRAAGFTGDALRKDGSQRPYELIKDDKLMLHSEPSSWYDDIRSFLKNKSSHSPVLVVLSGMPQALYDRLKRILDVDLGIRNVCSDSEHLNATHGLHRFAVMSHKLNLKLGGINTEIRPAAESKGVFEEDTMVMSIQLLNPTSDSCRDLPSIAVVTAATTHNCSRYIASVRLQPVRYEQVGPGASTKDGQTSPLGQRRAIRSPTIDQDWLDAMVQECIDDWRVLYKQPPSIIVLYCAGVSTSQYASILSNEAPTVRRVLQRQIPDAKVGLTVVATSTNNSTRFIPTKGTLKRALLVDDERVAQPHLFDFFLKSSEIVSQTKPVKPTYYVVLKDEAPFTPEGIQDLTYALTHLAGADARAVSVPAPVYWASKVSKRARGFLLDGVRRWIEEQPKPHSGAWDVDAEAEGVKKNIKRTKAENRIRRENLVSYLDIEKDPEIGAWNGKVHENLRKEMWFA